MNNQQCKSNFDCLTNCCLNSICSTLNDCITYRDNIFIGVGITAGGLIVISLIYLVYMLHSINKSLKEKNKEIALRKEQTKGFYKNLKLNEIIEDKQINPKDIYIENC